MMGRMAGDRDVFLAHAHQDKSDFVRPLAAELGRLGVSCWLDEAVIGPGDSLITAMNEGLSRSKFVVVVITGRFLAAHWANRELNAAMQLEVRGGRTKVLPVVAVDARELEAFPLLLDKRWILWEDGGRSAAREIAGLFDRPSDTDFHVDFPESYVGPVWARLITDTTGRKQIDVTFRWGPYVRRGCVEVDSEPVSIAFHKTGRDRLTLHCEVQPDAIVTFGLGSAPDEVALDFDEGWIRSRGWSFPESVDWRPMSDSAHERLDVRAGRDVSEGSQPTN